MKKLPPILKPFALVTFSLIIATATGVVNGRSYRQPVAETETTTTETTTEGSVSTDGTMETSDTAPLNEGENSSLQQTHETDNDLEEGSANSDEGVQEGTQSSSAVEQTPDNGEQPAR
ncbi:MAG: hypothetical protein L0L60_05750, partial [Tetragenococcus halophilus]|nr:hypothetical protein [Tetragenococcus halophilus]